jgi:protein SCO1
MPMSRVIRTLSPQAGIAVLAVVIAATLLIDAHHAWPVIQRYMEAREAPQFPFAQPAPHSLAGLNVTLETSSGELTTLAATQGRVRIATMFYSHCPTICPMVVDALQRIDATLTPSERAKLNVLMLSLDPVRDAPATLRSFASEHQINDPRWLLARTQKSDLVTVARTLGISYNSAASGIPDHVPALVLLDAQGKELARSTTLGGADPQFVSAVSQALRDART